MRAVIRLSTALLFAAHAAAAQGPSQRPFTPDDALDVVSHRVIDLSDDGRWLAAVASTRRDGLGVDYRRDGDPTYIRPGAARLWVADTRSGEQVPVFPDARNIRAAAWSPDASRLAVLVLRGDRFEPVIWDRAARRAKSLRVPTGSYVAENSDVQWTHDGRRIVVALRSDAWKARATAEFDRLTRGPIFVQDSKEPFLAWDAMRRMGNVRSVHAIDVATGKTTQLLPETMVGQYAISEDDSLLTWQEDITQKTDYDLIFGTENKLLARGLEGGQTIILQPTLKGLTLRWADNGRRYAYTREGRVYVTQVGDTVGRMIAGPDTGRAAADTSAAARAARASQRFNVVRWSPRADALLLSNRQGLWLADAASGSRELILAVDDSLPTAPRYTTIGWSNDGRFIYMTYAARTKWERGVVRYDRTNKALQELVKDDRLYQDVRVSRNGEVLVYASATGNRPSDLYVADASMQNARRLTDAHGHLAGRTLARTQLLTYLDADGQTRYGVAYLPPDYVEGRTYPTLFNVYEQFFDDTFDATVNVLTSNGYVVVKPSVGFETGFPGEAWLKGVTSAANAVVQAGIADSSRLGVFGTSYGGYAVNLLITQTKRFKAAVNISGKVDVISFYTDSPRLGVRNTHAAEKSQDRLGATLWQQPQKYIAHSAVMFADRITTPLLLITGEQDSNVPAGNTREMYYALRRLGKDVVWVNYMNSGHGTPGTNAEEFVDYHNRLLAFFGKHLKGEQGERIVEATSLLGEPLYRNTPSGETRERMEAQLAAARTAWQHTPNNADSIIWYGRRTAYLGRFNDAIAIYTDGITKHPGDARMYRHRGHRYLSTRKLDLAIRDFEKAASLVRGKADEVEPDGQPNARNIPTSTLQSNIWYHLGLGYYLSGDFTNALRAYREDMKVATNPDMHVATTHWLYMTLRRLGREAEASQVLAPISKDMDVIENGSYHRLLLLYKGELQPTDLLKSFGTDGNLDDVTTAYGVGNWHLYNGRRAEAEAIFTRILAAKSQWASFGYLSAESEMARGSVRVTGETGSAQPR
jgi:dipeptidyl aminopeptidase/acylaminoacyl peptidase/tetratricopeptide (TPR) repeat protein